MFIKMELCVRDKEWMFIDSNIHKFGYPKNIIIVVCMNLKGLIEGPIRNLNLHGL